MFLYSKERRVVDHENELYLNLFTQKSAALPCSWKWDILCSPLLKRAPQYRVLENGASFRLGICLTILGILCEFEGWQLLISKALVSILLPDG